MFSGGLFGGQQPQQAYGPAQVTMQAVPIMQPSFQNHFGTPQGARRLSNIETKESIDSWYNSTKAMIRAIPTYQRYMDLTWSAHSDDVNRGFQDHETDATMTALVQSTQVEALIDLVCYNVPEVDINHIRAEATSLNWIYRYIREHYGVKRTGRQMMQKFGVLQRKEGERLNSFWNRFQGFYAENRIRKNDEIKITNNEGKIINAPKDEIGERKSETEVLRVRTRDRVSSQPSPYHEACDCWRRWRSRSWRRKTTTTAWR